MKTDRRQFLTGVASATLLALAGCSGGEEAGMQYDGETTDVPDAAAEYLSDTSNFEGEAADWTGREEVSVTVGSRANGGNNGYGPAAIAVSAGTTVVWEWNGKGAPHNVIHEQGEFNSGVAVIDDDETFSHTFEEAGLYRYYCSPHRRQGMKGIVVVE